MIESARAVLQSGPEGRESRMPVWDVFSVDGPWRDSCAPADSIFVHREQGPPSTIWYDLVRFAAIKYDLVRPPFAESMIRSRWKATDELRRSGEPRMVLRV